MEGFRDRNEIQSPMDSLESDPRGIVNKDSQKISKDPPKTIF